MSLTVTWLMSEPRTVSRPEFETWYLKTHAEVARRMPGLRRYAVSRVLGEVAERDVFRVAQLVWDDKEAAEAAFNAPEGYVTVADGGLNTPGADYVEAMAMTSDISLDVARPAGFDILAGGFGGRPDGLQVRMLAFGDGPGPGLDCIPDQVSGLGTDPRIRGHVIGTSIGQRLAVGRTLIPGEGQPVMQWSWELWFDDLPDARAVVGSDLFLQAWAAVTVRSDSTFRGLFVSQELFCSVPARLVTR